MLPKRPERSDIETLTWEYLDGEARPTRLAKLETLLRERREAREQFIEHAQLHAMLHDFFQAPQQSAQPPAPEARPAVIEDAPRRRKRRRKNSAA